MIYKIKEKAEDYKIKTLWQGEWVSVISPVSEKYEALHEPDVVFCLPYLEAEEKYIIRSENCPPYKIKDKINRNWYTILSGKVEENEDPVKTMVREIQEEAGVKLIGYSSNPMASNIPVCKSTDMRAYIFMPTVYEYEYVEATGDGTEHEEKSNSLFVSKDELKAILEYENIDFLLFSMVNMMLYH
jgi:8-oxo-dGTP pyrophosphatase MutT (NUDIX family)